MNRKDEITKLQDEIGEALESPDVDMDKMHIIYWRMSLLHQQNLLDADFKELIEEIRDRIKIALQGHDF